MNPDDGNDQSEGRSSSGLLRLAPGGRSLRGAKPGANPADGTVPPAADANGAEAALSRSFCLSPLIKTADLDADQLWQSIERAEHWSSVKAAARRKHKRENDQSPAAAAGLPAEEKLPRVSRGDTILFRSARGTQFVIRPYRRGGYVRYVSRDLFLSRPGAGLEATRPYRELSVLTHLRERGCAVVKPAAALVEFSRRRCVYRGWLVTELLPEAENFLLLASGQSSPVLLDRLRQWSYAAGKEARKVLRSGVYHPDLHPGNVLIAERKRVVLLDFDKAERFPASRLEHYVRRTEARWTRSIEKHFGSSPQMVSSQLGSSLRNAFISGLRG